jgi:ribosomal protein L7/L12
MPASYAAEDLDRKFSQINERLRGIEAQIAKLSSEAGIEYEEPAAEAPPEVLELAQAGKSMDAVKKYRELTGADLEKARAVVGGL